MKLKSFNSVMVRSLKGMGILALVVLVGAAPPARKSPVYKMVAARPLPAPYGRPAPCVTLLHDAIGSDDATPVIRQLRVLRMEVTAYCPCKKCCGPNAQGITASGLPVSYNGGKFVAADTDVLRFGTQLMIPGYDQGPVEVIDRGGAIKGRKLDLYFPTHDQALEWGRKWVDVVVVE